jgi:nucleotide-binding universal stress UspA family protein
MYDVILAPLDGSKRAEKILPYIETLAHRFGSQVILLQVLESMVIYPGPHSGYGATDFVVLQRDELKEEAKAYLTGLQGEFREKQIEVKIVVAEGPVVPSIIKVAEREGVDLIAMASHGRTGLARVFYGSVAAGILNQADRPLLIIRSESE